MHVLNVLVFLNFHNIDLKFCMHVHQIELSNISEIQYLFFVGIHKKPQLISFDHTVVNPVKRTKFSHYFSHELHYEMS